ncbi:Phosphate starvation-inducible protein PsiF [Polaromonas sp. CG9_12]|nr:Phosphate starvation-inducible protein PsiF [Polaromonas sp. CG9_12]
MHKPMSLLAIAFALTMGLSAGAQAQSTPAAPAKAASAAPATAKVAPVSPAAATVEPPAKTAQQSKMATCNKDATGKKGDERKAFMKECLSAKPAAQGSTQQSKMKTCNADAKGKTGDERKTFMKSCLSS